MATTSYSGDKVLDSSIAQWLKHDKNPSTRQEVEDDINNLRWDKLKKTMIGRQAFGTAGLRGKIGAGFQCMNDVVVLQTAQGLCSYLKKVCNLGQLHNGVVIGYDGRHNSKRFAELSAKVFTTASIPVHLFSEVCPTPLVSFATIHYKSAAGIMVTASHNPKEYNGYKVYWSNGSQIITPHDDNILEEIEQNLDIPEEHWDISAIRSDSLVTDCLAEVTAKYTKYIAGALNSEVLSTNRSAAVRVVYSALHGVGYQLVMKAFKAADLKKPISVAQQQNPDPEFPTVKFPNPEELPCLAMSHSLADQRDVRLVMVNDPDADRLVVSEYDESRKAWKVFSGNQMGALLGWWMLYQNRRYSSTDPQDVYFLASVVSSKLLQKIAHAEGCQFVETLTGFKWMGNATLVLSQEGKVPLFAFEEAVGYMCGHQVPDKDGVSAAVQVASLASHLYVQGSSLAEKLTALYAQHGYHASFNAYFVCNEPATIQKIFRRIRNYHGPGIYPTKVADCEIESVNDMAAGVVYPESDANSNGHLRVIGTGLDLEYKGGEMVMFRCRNGLSVTVRTSGTEPKIKFYTELVAEATTEQEQLEVKKKLLKMVHAFIDELVQPKENGLLA